MSQGHSGAHLQIRSFGIEELFREGSLRFRTRSRLVNQLMTQSHSRILGSVLEDQVLSLGEASKALEGAEGDERGKPALLNPSRAIPFPEIVVLRSFACELRQGSACDFKGTDFRSETSDQGDSSYQRRDDRAGAGDRKSTRLN